MPAVVVDHVGKSYRRGTWALDDVCMEVDEGEVVAVLGPNGAGKTTLVRIISTLLSPTTGKVSVMGRDGARSPAEVRRILGYVPQGATAPPESTAEEYLAMVAALHGVPAPERGNRIRELLAWLELDRVGRQLTRSFSGGMRRRLDLAAALVHRPAVLVFDEPTTGLDPVSRRRIWSHVKDLVRRHGTTLLLTTHYLEEADTLADRVVILDQGRVAVSGRPEALKAALGGDRVRLVVPSEQLATVHDALAAARLDGIPTPTTRSLGDGTVQLEWTLPAGPQAAARLTRALLTADVSILGMSVSSPSLDDVFQAHTGRTLQEAQEQALASTAPQAGRWEKTRRRPERVA